jgi:hypothetical protein
LRHAIALNANFYETAQNTPLNHHIALTIVILASLSRAVGSTVILLINRASLPVLLLAFVIECLAIVAGYYFWSFTVFKIGQWLKPIDPTYQELLIPIGFAYAPQVFNFLTVIPLLGRPIELILAVWSLLAIIVAARQGLDISTLRAAFICVIGWSLIELAIGSLQILEQSLVR